MGFKIDRLAVRSMANNAHATRAVDKLTDKIRGSAADKAPSRFGDFEKGLRTEPARGDGDRTVGSVVAGDVNQSDWHLIEFGGEDTPASAPIRSAADDAGLTLRE